MQRWLAMCVVLLATPVPLAAGASARRILGAGRESVEMRWEPASGPVAFYELTCTVDGVPDVLIGTTSEPRLEIGRDPAAWGQIFDACVVQAFGEDGYPGPPSEPSVQSFRFLPDVDLDGDGFVASRDLVQLLRLLDQGRIGMLEFMSMRRTFGCRVDPTSRTYVDCAGGSVPAP